MRERRTAENTAQRDTNSILNVILNVNTAACLRVHIEIPLSYVITRRILNVFTKQTIQQSVSTSHNNSQVYRGGIETLSSSLCFILNSTTSVIFRVYNQMQHHRRFRKDSIIPIYIIPDMSPLSVTAGFAHCFGASPFSDCHEHWTMHCTIKFVLKILSKHSLSITWISSR